MVTIFTTIAMIVYGTLAGDWVGLPLRLVTPTVIEAKPCEPVFVLLEAPSDHLQWAELRDLTDQLAKLVVINNIEFSEIVTGLNRAGGFAIDEDSLKRMPQLPSAVTILGVFYIDYGSRACLFPTPGDYDVVLRSGTAFRVHVADIELADQPVLAEIRKPSFVEWILSGGERHDEATLEAAERLLAENPTTYYSKILGPCIAMAKLNALRRARTSGGPEGLTVQLEKELLAARQLLGPYTEREITSPLIAVAYWRLGEILGTYIHSVERTAGGAQVANRAEAVRLLEAVCNSSYSMGQKRKAVELLARLNARE